VTILTAAACEGFITKYLLPTYAEAVPMEDFHREMLADACLPDSYLARAYPRGTSKTTTLNLGFSLACAMLRTDPYQLKLSRTVSVAKEFLGTLKNQLLNNDRLIEDFGILPEKEWEKSTEDDFICNFEDGYRIRMRAFGCEQPMRGTNWNTMRPSLVICDDMEDDEQVLSPERRQKVMNWFLGTLIPIGNTTTRFRVFGTVLHAESLLQVLLESEDWQGKVFEACDDEVSEKSLLWPRRMTRDFLLKQKKMYVQQGNLIKFNMEYRNIATDMSSGYFQSADFVANEASVDDNKRKTYYVGIDFAIDTKSTRDFTVMVVGGVDQDGFLHIVDVRRGRWDALQIYEEMFSVYDTWKPDLIFAETGGIEKGMRGGLEILQRQKGVYLPIRPMVPIGDKKQRARSIQSRMRARACRFDKRNHWYPEFESELIQFDRGKHDDQVDAFAWLGIGLADMVTPLTNEEDDWMRDRQERRQVEQARSMTMGPGGDGRSIAGY